MQTLSSAELPDVDKCAAEPIHIPGAIQPHGALLCVSPEDLRLLHASRNAAEMLGIAVSLGEPIDHPALVAAVRLATDGPDAPTAQTIRLGDRQFHLTAHRTGQGILLDLEQLPPADIDPHDQTTDMLRRFLERIESVSDIRRVCAIVAEKVRRITGFNRVLIYRFDADWHGTVIAEDSDGTLPSYLDLRFPASDIPAQARGLYRRNRLRLIPNRDYTPSPLEPALSPLDGQPLDLAASSLRSVSPVHLRYMQNMQTAASMSVSLVSDGRLWGLIACHDVAPRWVSPRVRSVCDVLGQVMIQQIVARERMAEIGQRIELKRIETAVLVSLARAETFQQGLVDNPTAWLTLTDAAGAAVITAGQVDTVGDTPDPASIQQLADWLHNRQAPPVFATDCLADAWPQAPADPAKASGLLAISVSQLHASYIMWFRPELVRAVTWAGDPRKSGDPGMLNPRTSFEQWKEMVRGKAKPWSPAEIETAADFRNAVVNFVLRRAEERAALTERLQVSNRELEAFSYSVSHDLRAPFRHIVGYAELLRDHRPDLDGTALRYLDTIKDAALNAGRLVDDLLAFSQLSRSALAIGRIDMNKLVNEARITVMRGQEGRTITWSIAELPEAWGDAAMLRQAMVNLLSNAVKYTSRRTTATIEVSGHHDGREAVITVRDNGVGFDMRYVGKLFGVFQRLHRIEDFEGTGIGLALTKRIIDRHNGWITAAGAEDQGATFTFGIPARQDAQDRETLGG